VHTTIKSVAGNTEAICSDDENKLLIVDESLGVVQTKHSGIKPFPD
jgi:hypothetical protein